MAAGSYSFNKVHTNDDSIKELKQIINNVILQQNSQMLQLISLISYNIDDICNKQNN